MTVPNNPPATTTPVANLFSAATFRFPQPEHYKGERDGFKCEIWLTAITRFFKGARIPDHERTLHAPIFLTDDATLWWEGNALSDEAPWDDFVKAFRAAFQPAGFIDQVRNMLFDIKMTSTVSDYVERTRKYMSFLCPHDMSPDSRLTLEQAATSCFLKGAPKDLRQVLLTYKLNNPKCTIQDLCSVAEQFDQIYEYKVRPPSSSSSAGLDYTAASANAIKDASMAMDIDNITVAALVKTINNLSIQVNNLSRNNNRSRSGHHQDSSLKRLTPEDKQYLIKNNGCFRCRKINAGHYATSCPGPVSVNNMTSSNEGGSPSGNAPGN
ncbi:hypothetical protein EMPS_02968 [Entomortierella parvispora]|uniref:Retrotransposon gag domain-containing protein n=1 Tax=Entomortierella parvispora TaxID=205924 RepID=A0A9P3H5P5_9FUNG|nr:hypothetical protein EMPS_02968 [Entomortierella parvispora]